MRSAASMASYTISAVTGKGMLNMVSPSAQEVSATLRIFSEDASVMPICRSVIGMTEAQDLLQLLTAPVFQHKLHQGAEGHLLPVAPYRPEVNASARLFSFKQGTGFL